MQKLLLRFITVSFLTSTTTQKNQHASEIYEAIEKLNFLGSVLYACRASR